MAALANQTDDVVLHLRRLELTLSALQRNMDDFYFVSLTAITFGSQFYLYILVNSI